MKRTLKQMVKRLLKYRPAEKETTVPTQMIHDAFTANPSNPFLVSFPRTGSHWFRMVAELYFERPSLVRAFYYPEKTDYLFLHTHDLDLDVQRQRVIYLYRDPVPTIYSQLTYHKDALNDYERIRHWAEIYGKHLDKWLYRETFTTQKLVLTYEAMKADLTAIFAQVTAWYGESLDHARLGHAAAQVTKDEVKQKTTHDPQVVKLDQTYDISREAFREQQGAFVWEVVLEGRAHLRESFAHLEHQG